MYNHNFLCTYHLFKDDDELSNLCYQQQFLQAFDLDNYNNQIIETTINNLYNEKI